ncbi:MAG: DUF6364 family protein [Tunicatimonas sp.]
MTNTKLTLKLDAEVIKQAKRYAQTQQKSLSNIVENYLKLLTESGDPSKKAADIEISPFVKSMTTGTTLPSDIDEKAIYSNHLIEKYQ